VINDGVSYGATRVTSVGFDVLEEELELEEEEEAQLGAELQGG
jgi:hypothetical protein